MTAPELLPCPFCGKVAHFCDDVCHSTAFFVGCETLGCFGNARWDETQEEAVSKWNTRADIANALVAAAYEAAAQEVDCGCKCRDAVLAAETKVDRWYACAQSTCAAMYIRALTPADAKAALEAVRREARAEALREAYNALFVVPAASTEQEHMAQRCQFEVHSLIDKETTE